MTPNHTNPLPPLDRLDRVLADFFKNELPHPWPAPPAVTVPSGLARDQAAAGRRSRYTLAASVAMLLGLGLYLSSTVPGGQPQRIPAVGPDVNKAEATGDKLLHHANPKASEHDPMGIPAMP